MIVPSETPEALVVSCGCDEDGCATCLELTPEGILAIEDVDGLRLSLLLPDWLDNVMRTAIAAHAPGTGLNERLASDSLSAWPAPTTEEPDLETLEAWMHEDGGCEATDGCWIEADGTCIHGYPSWLLALGLI